MQIKNRVIFINKMINGKYHRFSTGLESNRNNLRYVRKNIKQIIAYKERETQKNVSSADFRKKMRLQKNKKNNIACKIRQPKSKRRKIMQEQIKPNPSFHQFVYGEQSLYEWLIAHKEEAPIDELPDKDSVGLNTPELSQMNFIDGVLDSFSSGNNGELAKGLFELLSEFSQIGVDDLNDELIDMYLGKIYKYTIEHRTIDYIDDFLELLKETCDKQEDNQRLLRICVVTARQFLKRAVHREAVKFALAVLGITILDDEDLRLYCSFGIAEEFARFVAVGLTRGEHNDEIFALAKVTKGWGRIAYVDYLKAESDEIKEWLIFEGYQCDIGIDHIVLDCLEKGDLLGFIKRNGFDEKLYVACGEMIDSFSGLSKVDFSDYAHSKELVCLFLKESKNQKMNLERFAIICNLFDYVKSEAFSESESKECIDIMSEIAYNRGIDWSGFIKSNPLDSHARIVARRLGIDVFDDVLLIAKRKQHFDDWYILANIANSNQRFKQVCKLAKERFPLESMKKEPLDELGLGREFRDDDNLSMIVQFCDRFDEVIGLELVETLLQSPVTRCRNMALNAIEHWQKNKLSFPESVFEIIRKNQVKDPNKDIQERYKKILESFRDKMANKFNRYEWCLQVWGEFDSSGIWLLWDKEKQERIFPNIGYEALGLKESLQKEFKEWQEIYDKYALGWYQKDCSLIYKKIGEAFDETGLELAKKLKMFFKDRAYVEYFVDGEVREIKYYYIDECNILNNERGEATVIENIMRELEIAIDDEKKAFSDIFSQLVEDCLDEWYNSGSITSELQEEGDELITKLNEMLPRYCCLEDLRKKNV